MLKFYSDRPRRRVAFVPRPDGLEGRLCLSGSAELLADGTLYIAGDNRRDSFTIVDDGQGTVGVLGNFVSFGDGAFDDPSGEYDALFEGVTAVFVETFGGNDYVEYRLTDPLLTPRNVTLNLGNGNDRAAVTVVGVEGVDLFIDVNLGRGNDRFTGGLYGDLLDAAVQFDVDGSAGNDAIGLVAEGLHLDDFSVLDMALAGDSGNDVVTADLELDPNSTGVLRVSVLGERGNDYVGLNVYGADFLADGSSLYLDGGPGRDRYGATDNVSVVNI